MYRTFAELSKDAAPPAPAAAPVPAAESKGGFLEEVPLLPPATPAADSMWDEDEVGSVASEEEEGEEEDEEEVAAVEEEELVYVPPPRNTSKIIFKHTPRVFKTPLRESKRGTVAYCAIVLRTKS